MWPPVRLSTRLEISGISQYPILAHTPTGGSASPCGQPRAYVVALGLSQFAAARAAPCPQPLLLPQINLKLRSGPRARFHTSSPFSDFSHGGHEQFYSLRAPALRPHSRGARGAFGVRNEVRRGLRPRAMERRWREISWVSARVLSGSGLVHLQLSFTYLFPLTCLNPRHLNTLSH